jgi:hypothetical protein
MAAVHVSDQIRGAKLNCVPQVFHHQRILKPTLRYNGAAPREDGLALELFQIDSDRFIVREKLYPELLGQFA